MATLTGNNLDYLAARLHARRSRLAEDGRLDALCRLSRVTDLCRAVFPDAALRTAPEFQRRLVEDLAWELADLRGQLSGAGGRLLEWMLARFEVENLKVAIRGLTTGARPDVVQSHLIRLPPHADHPAPESLAAARSLAAIAELLPAGPVRQSLTNTPWGDEEPPRLFLLEGALDTSHFKELLTRGARLPAPERSDVEPMLMQETDIFHLMLVERGRFHYGIESDRLRALHVGGTSIPRTLFSSMLGDPDVWTAAQRVVGRVIDSLPSGRGVKGGEAGGSDAGTPEPLAWQRLLRLANRAFRHSHMGLAAVVGYVEIRRAEAANLITLSEGIRSRLSGETIRARLISRHPRESAHV